MLQLAINVSACLCTAAAVVYVEPWSLIGVGLAFAAGALVVVSGRFDVRIRTDDADRGRG